MLCHDGMENRLYSKHIAIAKAMNSMQSHATSNPNTIAQHASIEGLTGDQSSVEEMRLAFDERRKYMVQRVNEIRALSCIVPKGAFYIMMNIKQLIGTTIKGITINGSMDFPNCCSNMRMLPSYPELLRCRRVCAFIICKFT